MFIENVRQRLGWIYRTRSIYLFVTMLMFIVLLPLLDDAIHIQDKVVANLLNMFVLVAAVAAVGRSTRSFVIALLLTLPVIGFQLAGLLLDVPDYLFWSWIFGAVFYAFTLICLLNYVFRVNVMNADKLFGAAAAYMLLGILWAYFYMIAQHMHPNGFTFNGQVVASLQPDDLIYFSYTVLTSTGFGDISPLHPAIRALTNLEQISGVLFVAILIARLAGIYPEQNKTGT